jgi:tRNA(fMet)-specific endonuclease VapC
MLKYLLDTNIVIYTINEKPAHVRDIFKQHQGQMAISTVTLGELLYGAEKSNKPSHNLQIVEGFASRLEVLPFDSAACAQWSQVRNELRSAGTPIGPYDQMIAGHARALGLVLVTHNTREFQRVSGLRLVDWAEPYPNS